MSACRSSSASASDAGASGPVFSPGCLVSCEVETPISEASAQLRLAMSRLDDAASCLRLPGAHCVSPAFSVHEDLSTGHLALEDAISGIKVALAHLRQAEDRMTGA
ncbi:hypothetical protein EYZ11_012643 [Aspergillus tanneri]|uniref:Uncharacterized protein n=1 Tax=Aspergillus tanneri TaxID=1220188 RepID=A0A4V3UMM9_9EURO|nr:uncharacterized protein ATNIH1004_011792 [Aspergillus tanneri]KAA8641656.1 hypothetical protein ATNIH1004_011792 [Aspergillus tanneri]THC87914.1 hypothetical protein EYZ11_012643 [Aspergillus tanneri]